MNILLTQLGISGTIDSNHEPPSAVSGSQELFKVFDHNMVVREQNKFVVRLNRDHVVQELFDAL